MFRCRFINQLDRWCLLKFKGKWYQITSFNDDYQDNQIQITASELANQQVNIVEPYYPSASVISGGSSKTHEVG
jgi:lipocalin